MRRQSKFSRRATSGLGGALIFYLAAAYVLVPGYWRHYERQQGLAAKSMTTVTSLGIAGDALNVGLEGGRAEILCAMKLAGWRPADPVTFRTSFAIAGSVLTRRAYPTAPVSDLFWEGRREDLAFEKPSGVSPSRRHHVRFWLALAEGELGQPVWLGGATYDRSVGVSHYTGQVTHHIDANIDAERNELIQDLVASGRVEATYQVAGVGPTLLARNGGGDPYFTDGEIAMARLRVNCATSTDVPENLPSAAETIARTTIFGWLSKLWRAAA
jgi:hypothetical protein